MPRAGKMIKTGYCTCNDPIIAFAADFFTQGLVKAMRAVLCGFLHAIDIIMAIGMMAIPPPGKAITGGMSRWQRRLSIVITANK